MKRVDYIDIFRAVGILCMIEGHIGFWGDFSFFMHAFHMPMFFFITGFFWKDTEFIPFLKKKIKTLIVPYFLWSMIHFVIWLFIRSADDITPIEGLYHMFFENTTNVPLVGTWFLTALFLAEIIYFLLRKISKDDVILSAMVVIVVLIGHIAVLLLPFRLPWALDAALVGCGFIHMAVILKAKLSDKVFDLGFIKSLLLLVVTTVLIFLNSEVNMRTGTYGNIILFWINAILSIVSIMNLCKVADEKMNGKICDAILSEMRYIGRNSICYLCLNISLIQLFNFILGSFINVSVIIKLLNFVLLMISIHLISILVNKKGLRILVGK